MNEEQTVLDDLCRRAAELIGATRGPLKSVRLRAGEMSVEVEWPEAPATGGEPVVTGAGGGPAETGVRAEEPAPEREDGTFVVHAPLVGTFYRAPSPDAGPFVEVGDKVEAGQQVAIVEAMKLMNAVAAEQSGRVVEVLVDDATPVEYGQPLFVLAPPD